jgi:hypothetical protein
MRTMISHRPSRCLVLLLASWLTLGASPWPAPAMPVDAHPGMVKSGAAMPAALVGGFTDNVLGNRTRMIQFAFVAFAVGVLILVTATRKH